MKEKSANESAELDRVDTDVENMLQAQQTFMQKFTACQNHVKNLTANVADKENALTKESQELKALSDSLKSTGSVCMKELGDCKKDNITLRDTLHTTESKLRDALKNGNANGNATAPCSKSKSSKETECPKCPKHECPK